MATGSDVRDIFQLKPASEQVRRAPRTEKKPDGISRELYGLIGNNVSTVAFNNPGYKPKLNLRTRAVSWTWRPFVNPMRDDDLVLHHWQKTMTDPNEEYYFARYNKIINLQEYTPEEYTKHLQDPDWTMEETAYLWDLCRRFDLRWVVIQDRYEWPPREEDAMAYRTIAGVVPKPEPSAQAASSSSSSAPSDTTITAATAATSETAMDTSSDANSSTTQPSSAGANSTSSAAPATSATEAAATTTSSTPGAGASTSTSTPSAAAASASTAPVKKEEPEVVRKTRTMEDLKARYYAINRILIKLRMNDSSQAVEKAQLLSSMAYDKNREIERKKNLEILNTRTPEQIEEEEALYLEARRIDQNEKKITRERENLLRLLNLRDMYGPGGPASAGLSAGGSLVGGGGSGIIIPSNSVNISSGPSSALSGKGSVPATPVTPTSAAAAASAASSNAGAASTATASTATATTATSSASSNKKRKKNAKQTDDSTTKGGSSSSSHRRLSSTSNADAATGAGGAGGSGGAGASSSTSSSSVAAAVPAPVKKEKLTPGAYLRSQKMTPIVSTKITRVQTTLAQLGMPYKPNMPTAAVMAKWDQLQTNIVTLLDLKKHVDKLENDLKVNKLRQSGGKGGAGAAGAGAAGGAGASSSSGQGSNTSSSVGLLPASSAGLGGADGSTAETHYGVKREGAPDDNSSTGQVKKKKSRKE
ncbi:swr complex subunit [Actinomortierella wolfii]|nr:swr complex subunit [Actinomortierella wolfii]